MPLSFGSINTGLPKDIVQKLLESEKIPIKNMEKRKEKLQEKTNLLNEFIKLVEALKGELGKTNSARNLLELKIITDNDLIDVIADKDIAEPGEYRFQVDHLAQKSSALTSGFPSPTESFTGVGYIQYFLPNGQSQELYVDEDSASLSGIAKLINMDKTNGMRANVVNDGSGSSEPWRLLITLENTGDENKAEFPYMYFVDGEYDLYMDEQREAKDANVKLDGFNLEWGDNKNSTAIPGLTIDLKKAKPGEEFSIRVVEDLQVITEKIKLVIDSINNVLAFVDQQNNLDAKTDTSRTLGGDLTLQTIERKIRSIVFSSIPTKKGYYRLGDIGVTFQRNGKLKLDEKRLEAFMSSNFQTASQLLVGWSDAQGNRVQGIMPKLMDVAKSFLQLPSGSLRLRKDGFRRQMEQIDSQIENRERIIDKKEKLLKEKYARLEGTIAKLKSQGAGLASMAQSNDPVAQLSLSGQ